MLTAPLSVWGSKTIRPQFADCAAAPGTPANTLANTHARTAPESFTGDRMRLRLNGGAACASSGAASRTSADPRLPAVGSASSQSPALWAVWSVWRGDRAKLARIARAVESCFDDDREVAASVHVRTLGDHEVYPSFGAFRDDASGQTTSGFDILRIERRGREGRIAVRLLRRGGSGVALTITPASEADARWAANARSTVSPAVSRGSIKYTKQKALVGAGSGALAALGRLNRRRRRVMRAWTAAVVALTLTVTYVVARPAWDAESGENAAAAVAIPVVAALAGLVPHVRNAVLPPIEIADRTPGRRVATRAGILAGPVIAFLTRALG